MGDDDAEYADMPKFAVTHEGWLIVKMGKWNRRVRRSTFLCRCEAI